MKCYGLIQNDSNLFYSKPVLGEFVFHNMFMDLSFVALACVTLTALLVGFSKTSVGGIGILAAFLMAIAFPGKASPGVLLPMLIVADIFAVIYYRRDCDWTILIRILPMTAVGIFIGYLIVDIIPFEVFEKVIGVIVLAMVVMGLVLENQKKIFESSGIWTYLVGVIAGIVTMIANAAGPVFGVYLLQMGLNKKSFVGTRSWYFLLLNIFKVPFSVNLGLITTDTLLLNVMFIPVIFIGALLGAKFLKMINLTAFKWLIRITALIAATKLILF